MCLLLFIVVLFFFIILKVLYSFYMFIHFDVLGSLFLNYKIYYITFLYDFIGCFCYMGDFVGVLGHTMFMCLLLLGPLMLLLLFLWLLLLSLSLLLFPPLIFLLLLVMAKIPLNIPRSFYFYFSFNYYSIEIFESSDDKFNLVSFINCFYNSMIFFYKILFFCFSFKYRTR